MLATELKPGRVYQLAHTVVNEATNPAHLVPPEPENAWPWWSLWPAGTRFYVRLDPVAKVPSLHMEGHACSYRLASAPFLVPLVACLVEVAPEDTTVLDLVAANNYPHALLLAALQHLGYVDGLDLVAVREWLDHDAKSPDIRLALITGVTPA